MQTILKHLRLNAAAHNEQEILDLINAEFTSSYSTGDLLGAGEWLASALDYNGEQSTDELVARILAFWASAGDLAIIPVSLKELVANLSLFDEASLCKAIISLYARHTRRLTAAPSLLKDLVYRARTTNHTVDEAWCA
jgi:hypothetical protein